MKQNEITKIRRQPFSLLNGLFMDDYFYPEVMSKKYYDSYPKTNIRDTEDNYHVEIFAPGYQKENFTLNVDKNILNISYEMGETKDEKSDNFTLKEYHTYSFQKNFKLPTNINCEKIEAFFKDGVLDIKIPKTIEKKEPSYNIEIK